MTCSPTDVPPRTRKVRGSRTQALVAEWYQRLWPAARTNPSALAGRDVLEVPLSIEVKGRRQFDPMAWIRQARKAARPAEDEFPPQVVMRPDGVGEQNVGDFLVIRLLADDTEILAEVVSLRQQVQLLGRELQKSAARDVAVVRELALAEADREDRRQANGPPDYQGT